MSSIDKQNSVPSRSPAGAAEVPTRADKGSGSIGLPVATPLVMGSVIGTGCFTLSSALAPYGPVSLVAFVLVMVGSVALALTFGAL